MNLETIANNIKQLRSARHWSQEDLAAASGVDVRTVQRAEAGRSLAIGTLRSLAAAFDTTIEALQLSEEEIAGVVDAFTKLYTVIEMRAVTRSCDLGELLAGTHALFFQRIGELTERQLDQIAVLEDLLRDYLDIWSDMDGAGRRDAEKSLYACVASLHESDMSVSFGTENMGMRVREGKPFRMPVLYIAITKGRVPMLAVARPKDMPISFVI